MVEEIKPLIGDVQTQFKFGKPEDFHTATEAARLEQEAMVGYPLVFKSTRQTHYVDDKGHDVYEVFATFAPRPPDPIVGGDATQV